MVPLPCCKIRRLVFPSTPGKEENDQTQYYGYNDEARPYTCFENTAYDLATGKGDGKDGDDGK
jgi:hypothetical protein